ncbi:MAG: 50S ribosomal protein L29 [Actinobacteria bacterium]|nr:50S ribosomal protein L29 [Actinomycetota bacterium]
MKVTEITKMSDSEVAEKIKETRTELFNLRFQLATGRLDNPARIKTIKREIARLHTELRMRELRAQRESAAS